MSTNLLDLTTHLTITGYDAGRPLCDVNKVEALARGEQFLHAIYAPIDKLTALCSKCKAEWDAAADDDSD